MTPTEVVARALLNSDLVARYNHYARKANPKTLYWESDDAIAQGWAPLVAAALRDLGYELRPIDDAAVAPLDVGALAAALHRIWCRDDGAWRICSRAPHKLHADAIIAVLRGSDGGEA